MTSIERLRNLMAAKGTPGLFVTDRLNVRWLTGFTGSSGLCIVSPDRAVFLTDSRYRVQAADEVVGAEVITYSSPKTQDEVLAEIFADLGLTQICFEKSMTYSAWESTTKAHSNLEWTAAPELFSELRIIKTPEEVEKIKAACKLADQVMEHVTRFIRPGVREYDVLLELEFFLKRNGSAPSFDPIIVGGPNSAKPHGKPGERPFEVGDFVTVDLGAVYQGYISDMTRTFVVGEASDKHRVIYDLVLKAEETCCAALKPGATGVEIDAIARKILDEKDLSQYFGHGLGHGIGLAVHDFGGLSPRSKNTIEVGQVWTIEPGVYLDGWGGVRIEDDVLVTPEGPEILTFFPKELMVLG